MSNDPYLDDLIQADIDGVANAAEREALRTRLDGDPEAREIHRKQRDLRDMLASLPSAVPPPGFLDAVLRSVEAARSADRRIAPFGSGVRRVLPYLYAAAAGAAVCFLALQWRTGGGPQAESTRAAMGSSRHVTDRMDVDRAGVRGEASVRYRRRASDVELDLAVPAPSRVSVRFDPAAVEFVEFSQETGGAREVEVSRGAVRWTQEGHERVTLRLAGRAPEGAAVAVGVLRDGEETALGSLRLPSTEVDESGR